MDCMAHSTPVTGKKEPCSIIRNPAAAGSSELPGAIKFAEIAPYCVPGARAAFIF
jgi:hypothetical protein